METGAARVPAGADGPGGPDALAMSDDQLQVVVARELASRYHFYTDGRDPRRPVRYVAIARSLDIRPYAVVTADLAELHMTVAASRPKQAGRVTT
jgi:hypothetical protein